MSAVPIVLGPARRYSLVALARQSVALQARGQRDVVDQGATAATLQTHLGGFRPHRRGRDDDAVHLHQTGHLLRLQGKEEKECDLGWSTISVRRT